MALQTRRLTNKFGVEITGLDLSKPMDDATVAEVWKVWNEQGLVLMRGQSITPDQHIAFSRRFGELDRHEALEPFRHPQYDEIFMVSTIPVNGKPSASENVGRHWHSDLSYTSHPAMGSLFHCQQVPEVGGDTLFANTVAAYDALSDKMKEVIDDLWGVHDYLATPTQKLKSPEVLARLRELHRPIAQPLVLTHPVTGRKALYIAETLITHFVGMTPEESQPLIRFLFNHTIDPLYTYRHKWTKGDFIMWDNRSLIHIALSDFEKGAHRLFFRTTILGEQRGKYV
jgi:taurine dioxygenase